MDDKSFIETAEMKLNTIINNLGWDVSFFQNNQTTTMVSCPHNNAHRMPPDKLESHLETCEWLSSGCSEFDVPFPMGDTRSSCVVLTPELQEQIITEAALQDPTFKKAQLAEAIQKPRSVPMSSNKLMQEFTTDERRAIYNYVVSNTESSVKITLPDIVIPQKTEEKRELTQLEILAAERDAKRRRATYRNKVHTNRKSHVEIMREVIDSQMNCLLEDSGEVTNRQVTEKRDGSIPADIEELHREKDELRDNHRESDDRRDKNRGGDRRRDKYRERDRRRDKYNEGDDRRERYRENDKSRIKYQEDDERNEKYWDKNHQSSSKDRERSHHRSRSDHRYHEDSRVHSERGTFSHCHEGDRKDMERSRKRPKDKEVIKEMGGNAVREEKFNAEVENLLKIMMTRKNQKEESSGKEKKHQKDESSGKEKKHKKHKKKKQKKRKKHKKSSSSSSSSDSD